MIALFLWLLLFTSTFYSIRCIVCISPVFLEPDPTQDIIERLHSYSDFVEVSTSIYN